MNRYGQMALDHNRQHQPDAYSQIHDPEVFFAEVGEEIAQDVTRLRDQILRRRRPGESLEIYRIRGYQALATAQELVLTNHPLLQPAPETEPEDWNDDPDLDRQYQQLAEINKTINTPL
ncbi:MAG TPA: hypothetical protein VL068_03390 [Microthrixaceae bacterium]|nr:hypothetical protein [Microthrixaceae bacterium]